MKKVFLLLAVFIISATTFAQWEGTFHPSCGGSFHVVCYGNTQAEYVACLQAVNLQVCGTSKVLITFY